jgi:hypothetical protein
MKKKMKLELNDDLFEEINEYCKLNNIENVDKFIYKLIKSGFNIGYGDFYAVKKVLLYALRIHLKVMATSLEES